MLHIINKNDGNGALLHDCMQIVSKGSSILLIENGVYCGVKNQLMLLEKRVFDEVNLYVLTPDLEARGLLLASCYGFVKPIDYDGFVQLVADNSPIRSWF